MPRKLNAYTVFLILSAGNALFFTLTFTINMVYQASTIGLDALQLVLVGTTLETTAFLFEIPTGIVADVYSRRLSIIIGTLLIGVAFLIEGSIPMFATVLLSQVLWGIGVTFTSGATEAWIVDEVGEANLGSMFIRASQVSQIAEIVGVVLSTALASILINLPIALSGVCFLALGLFLMLFMPETGFNPVPRGERSTFGSMFHTFSEGLRAIRKRRVLILLLLIGLFVGLYSEGFDRLWTPHFLDDIGLPTLGHLEPVVWFGIFSILGKLLGVVAQELLRRRLAADAGQGTIRSLILISAGMCLSLLIFGLALNFPLAFVAFMSFGLLRRLSGPLFSAWVNPHIPAQVRATVLSTFNQVDALGQIGGGPVLGLIGQQISIPAALAASAGLLLPVPFLYKRLLRMQPALPPDS